MSVTTNLDRSVGGCVGHGTRREVHLGIDGKRREGDLGEALGGKLGIVNDDILDFRMGRLSPVGCKWCHCVTGQ